jgi:hypothetical protein
MNSRVDPYPLIPLSAGGEGEIKKRGFNPLENAAWNIA